MLLLGLATLAAAAASPKRVLILHPFGRDVAPFNSVISAFRTTVARELAEPLDFYEVPLDLARLGAAEGEGPLLAFLEGRLKSQPVDLVVPVGAAAVQFAARHRQRLFSDTPLLALAPDPRFVPPGFLQTNATLVTQKVDLTGMVEDILQLQPQTTNIAVVFGSSALEKTWVRECRHEFEAFTNRVGFTWLEDLTLEQVLSRCASLPPRSFILHGLFLVDTSGLPCENNEALRRLHQTANAPLFAYFASEFGLGPIGGRLFQDTGVGAQGARVAIRLLRGEGPAGIPPQVLGTAAPSFDWRELQRWGLGQARLPAGSVIRFYEPDFWERYRWLIVGTVVFCLLQGALIAGLLVSRAQRRAQEGQVRQLSLAVEQSPVSVVITDLQGKIIYVNGKFSEVSGYTFAECLGQNPRLLKSGESPPATYQELWARITGGGTWRGEFQNRKKNGELFWEWAVISPLFDAAGMITHFVGAKEDITARKQTEQALRRSEARLAAGTELAGLGYHEVDFGEPACYVDDRFHDLCGVPAGHQPGLQSVEFWLEHLHPDDRQRVSEERQKLQDGRLDRLSLEYRYLHPVQGQRWLQHLGGVAERDDSRRALRTFGVVRDITELKRAEAGARDLSGQLLRAQEAERARIAKELHDGLSQNLALLSVELDMFGQRLPETAGQINNARLAEFSQQIKGLSAEVHRISHGLHPAKLTQLGLAVALKGFCREMEMAHGLAVRFEAREVPRVLPEDVALCLYRVTQEAIQNVVKHSGARHARVELVAAGHALALTISDNGRGFVAGAERTTGSLGLVSMHERVRLVQGEIAVNSQPGKGTRLEVRVPLARAEGPEKG